MKENIDIRRRAEKCVLTFILVLSWLFAPKIGYENGDMSHMPHLFYMFIHANIWHLLGNLFVLWILRGRLYLLPSMAIAFLASYIPCFSIYGDVGMTIGLSGVLFAIVGIKWGNYCKMNIKSIDRYEIGWKFLTRVVPFALVGILIPHINWCLHSCCLLAGFIYGRYRRQ